jgi:hypothetical protein
VRPLELRERRWVAMGLAWALGSFGLSVFVPSRSSLYVCLPLAGVAIAGAAAGRAIWSQASPRTRSWLLVAALVVPLALVPLHRSRSLRSRQTALLSTKTLADLAPFAVALRPGQELVLRDDPDLRPNLRDAFGSLLREAIVLKAGIATEVELLPGAEKWTEARLRRAGDGPAGPAIRLRLSQGRLEADAP